MYRFIISLLLLTMTVALVAEGIPYAAPEFIQSIFDQFSRNYLNAEAVGRGHTGVALPGGINSVLINPASLQLDGAYAYMELFLKPNIDEMNTKPFRNSRPQDVYITQEYNSTIPFGIVGFGMPVHPRLDMALVFAVPQSIKFDSFARETQDNGCQTLRPSFTHSQFVVTGSSHWGDLSLGLNLLADLYIQKDYRNYWMFGREQRTDFALRAQPGIRWQHGVLALGGSFTSPATIAFDMNYDEDYNVTIPMVIAAGAACTLGSVTLAADVEHEMCSQQSDDFDDRTRLKFGAEKRQGPYTARVGVMQSPGVFAGELSFPDKPAIAEGSQNSYYWPLVTDEENHAYAVIPENDQLFFTGGLSYAFRAGDLHLSMMADMLGDVPVAQIYMAFSVNLASLKKNAN
ncbi:MAG: hypothetical protein K8R90_03910 [Candidatus Cloacimonetes bacterium]|nr:hypothetical protein [Candidatus Cloacimonadota bacterium]